MSLHASDVTTAVTSLIHAIHRAESLADLRIEWKEFYAKEQDFQRVVNSVNVRAKSGAGTNKSMNLLLAYYSFLNGDLKTAIAATELVEEQATGGASASVGAGQDSDLRQTNPLAAAAMRFGELLVDTRDQSGAPPDSGE